MTRGKRMRRMSRSRWYIDNLRKNAEMAQGDYCPKPFRRFPVHADVVVPQCVAQRDYDGQESLAGQDEARNWRPLLAKYL